MKIMIYLNGDGSDVGQTCRFSCICDHFLKSIPGASILLVSGLGNMEIFPSSEPLNYIQLPTLDQPENNLARIVKLRSDIILLAALDFNPDIFLVDETPYGTAGELEKTIAYLRSSSSQTKLVLLLKDVLDHPDVVVPQWQADGHYKAFIDDYDQILVLGMREVFNVPRHYHFSAAIKNKTQFCGYIRYAANYQHIQTVRKDLQMLPHQRLVVVAPDSGEHSYGVIATYLQGIALLTHPEQIQTVIFLDPKMPEAKQNTLLEAANLLEQVVIKPLADDLMDYLIAADAVVSMGNYDRLCQIFSAATPAIVIPQASSSHEQLIRTICLKKLGLLKAIHLNNLTSSRLMELIWKQLQRDPLQPGFQLDLEALPRIGKHLIRLTNNLSSSNLEVKHDRRSNFDRRSDAHAIQQLSNLQPCHAQTASLKSLNNRTSLRKQMRLIVS
jgi:predicted glycosyltransferase